MERSERRGRLLSAAMAARSWICDGCGVKGELPSRADVEVHYSAARAVWPSIEVSLDQFLERVRTVASLEHLDERRDDFYLACAAGRGDEAAIAVIESACLTSAAGRLRRWGASPDDIEEALQATRERLFVGRDPKIASYTGATPLKQWVQLVAVRVAIDQRRARRSRPDRSSLVATTQEAADTGPDPASSLLKKTYRAEFERALQAQFLTLEPRDRTILKLYLIEGVSVEKIAAIRSVHRVTVARWLWHASEQMLAGVRQYFHEHHGLVPRECDSLVNLIRSQLTLDWSRIFDS